MDPQNRVRLETLFPDFCFQGFWHFSYVGGMGDILNYPPDMSLL